jgi:uncharacterized membrane protein YfcA
VTALWAAAAAGVLIGAGLQSAIGFGFSLVAAPLIFAAAGPEEAVGLLLVLGAIVNLLTLSTERRRPQPLARPALVICLTAVPGMIAGVAILRSADPAILQVLLTVAVFTGLAVQRTADRRGLGAARPLPVWAMPLAGVAAGVLTTTTTTSGPPIVLLLRGRGLSPARVRDTLTVVFMAFTFTAAAVLLAAGIDRALPQVPSVLGLLPLVVAGHLAGRQVFAWLARGHYEAVLTAVLVVSSLTGLLAALL